MPVSFNLADDLDAALKSAAAAAGLDDATAFTPEVRTADPRHGDFQANGVLGYAKARKLNPRAVAEKVIGGLSSEVRANYDVTIAGPGFINFTLKPATLLAWLQQYDSAERLRTGQVVWFNLISNQSGDLRDAEGAETTVQQMLMGLPL